MISNKNFENQASVLTDSITSNSNATFKNAIVTGILTLPNTTQSINATTILVDTNSAQTLTNKTISKTQVGLDNVDNTSDANKPISTATTTQLNLKAPLLNPTFTGTVILPSTQALTSSVILVDLDSAQTLTNKTFNINLPTSFYSPSSTQLGYIMNATTTNINILLTTSTPASIFTLTLPAYGVWMVSAQIEYFCYSTTSLSYSQISQSITPSSVFTNNNSYSQFLLSGTLPTNNSIIQQIQGIFNINATPSGSNNVLNLISVVTFSAGNVLVKCLNGTTTSTTTGSITASTTVVISVDNTAIAVGMKITGTGISATPPIVTAKSGTTITMSSTQTLSASTVLTFTNTAGNTFLNATRIG